MIDIIWIIISIAIICYGTSNFVYFTLKSFNDTKRKTIQTIRVTDKIVMTRFENNKED